MSRHCRIVPLHTSTSRFHRKLWSVQFVVLLFLFSWLDCEVNSASLREKRGSGGRREESEPSRIPVPDDRSNYLLIQRSNSTLYLAKLAYAKKLVGCFTLGENQIPALDRLTQLITEAQCLTEDCKECLRKNQECEKKREEYGSKWIPWESLTQETFCNSALELEEEEGSSENSTNFGANVGIPPNPAFHCYLPRTNGSFDAYYRIQYQTHNYLDNLLGESKKDLIPRLFVVEKAGGSENATVVVTTSWIIPYEDVLAGKDYSLSVTPVSPGRVYPKTILPPRRFPVSSEREERKPTDVTVNFDLQSVGTNQTSLLIRWKSGAGENASCDSSVFILDNDDDDFVLHERKEPTKAFWTTMAKRLDFGKNYSVYIVEKFGGKEFGPKVFAIQVPSCYSIHSNSLKRCAPQKVSNIIITFEPGMGLKVTWNPPPHMSSDNPILRYNLTVSQTELFATRNGATPGGLAALHNIHKIIYTTNISGKETSWKTVGRNITKTGGIQVWIQAFSEGGASEPAVSTYEFPSPDVSTFYEKIWIPIVVVLCLFFLIIAVAWLKYYKDKLQRKKQLHEYFEKLDKESIQLEPAIDRFSSKWEISSGALVLGDVIGEGAFGLVRKAILYKEGHKLLVAVKTLRGFAAEAGKELSCREYLLLIVQNLSYYKIQGRMPSKYYRVLAPKSISVWVVGDKDRIYIFSHGIDETDSGKFWEEFNILKGLDPHKHVVGLVGIVKAHVPALVVEYCHGGDLQSHLRRASQARAMQNGGGRRFSRSVSSSASTATYDSSSTASQQQNESRVKMSMVTNEAYFLKKCELVENVTELDLLSYSRQIACGMEFLSSNKIVHRDLAARNVLIGQNKTLKIADFGLSRDVYEQNWYKKNSDGKIPIKWLAIECLLQEVYTTKSDVWSFGILLWEIVTFGGNPYPGVENTRIFDLLKSGYRMSQPENCSPELYDLMCQCWSEKSVDRPDFASIRKKLDDIIEKSNLVVYMNIAHNDSSNSASSLDSDLE